MTKTGFCAAMLIASMLAGCHSGVKVNQQGAATQGNTANSQPANVAPVMVDELNNPNGPLAKRSIYFDFDSYTVKSDDQPLLEAHAKYLMAHPNRHVLIQGNTDERGTSEYNLALGERRSEAVLHDLETLGVRDSQLEAVSFGKEKPVALGHDEASWAQNRRADLVYQ
ncbi:peptidoglycan-associated lipoprotein Pal [Paraburkholderia phenazinium]|jgi:peptidoglycan-associated lipoprotein|uniref:Peptidoglycan-associated lipoprotein n=1 Tax=Paraburkholderia phenazinium TaxID=60549 RepID=A0A1G8C2U4_9BURK|nr:peptidoglycan-associated lipoprotein Pal [Paraburkholderia phenazinium]SDH39796.1 peptidoglycan-associated lipoprotein [Paraburkholderia phenazinium]